VLRLPFCSGILLSSFPVSFKALLPLLHLHLQGGIVGDQHDQDQDDRVDQHAVAGQEAQHLRQHDQQRGRDDRARHVAQSAEHDVDQDQNGRVEVELRRRDGGIVQHVQGPGRTGQSGGHDKGERLGAGDIDADGFRGDAVVAAGHDGTAFLAVHQVVDQDQGHDDQQDAGTEVGRRLDAGGAHRAADKHLAAFGELDVVGDEGEMQTGGISADVHVVQNAHDDLAERQCDDGQIVALQLQDRDADQPADQTGQQRTGQNADDKTHRRAADGGSQQAGNNDGCEAADTHESRLAQIPFAGHADVEVQADGGDDIAGDRHQQRRDQTGHAVGGRQDLNQRIGQQHDHEREGAGAVFFTEQFFHAFPPLHFLADFLAEQSGRLDQQHDDQNAEDDSVGKLR